MGEEGTAVKVLAVIQTQAAVSKERHEETLRYRKERRKREEALELRLSALESVIDQGKGAVSLFLKIGTIATSFAAVGAAAWALLTKQSS